jgi:hypothetical protein
VQDLLVTLFVELSVTRPGIWGILEPPSPLYPDQMNTLYHRPGFPLLAGLPFAGEKGDRNNPFPDILKPVLPVTPVSFCHDTR